MDQIPTSKISGTLPQPPLPSRSITTWSWTSSWITKVSNRSLSQEKTTSLSSLMLKVETLWVSTFFLLMITQWNTSTPWLLSLSVLASHLKTLLTTLVSMLFTTSAIKIPKKSLSDWLRSKKERRENRKTIATKVMMTQMMKMKNMGDRVMRKNKKRRTKMMRWVMMRMMVNPLSNRGGMQRSTMLFLHKLSL